jgi:peptidyl-prolyl cis-trans isomerase C
MNGRTIPYQITLWLGIVALLVAGCRPKAIPTPTLTATFPETPTPVVSPVPPTATSQPTPSLPSVPLAAIVNGWAITQAEYETELALYLATQPAENANAQQQVLDELVDQALLAQAAYQAEYRVDDALLQARIDQLAAQLGGSQALNDWINANGYTEETFRWTLRRSIASAWMRDQIINAVPTVAEQIHARQILLYNFDEANNVLLQIRNGAKFVDLAFQYDPATGGDLGWFPRGYLTFPEIENSVFGLRADEVSDVVQSPLGYHIIQVIAIDAQRPLEANMRLVLQEKTLLNWVAEQRSQAHIEIRLPK